MNAIIHIDEIFLKGANQPFFYRQLKNNLEKLLPGVQVARVEGGMWLEKVQVGQLQQLSLIPGFANFAAAIKTKNTIEDIKTGIESIIPRLGGEGLKARGGLAVVGRFLTPSNPPLPRPSGELQNDKRPTFRISAERSFKNFPLSSLEIEKEIGEWTRLKYNWKVSLNNPDLNIHIAVGKNEACVYGNTTAGAGGLPTGSSGKVLVLLSGGIDSPVAAYKMMRRGAEIGLIHFQNQTKVTEEVSAKIFDLAKTLANYQPNIKLFMVPFADRQRQVVMKVPAKYRMLVTRRLFNKIAEQVALKNGYLALATGDSLGQVASQTLENMSVIYQAANLLKLAPLIGANKKDIISVARRIGTLDISARPYEDCCSLFVAKHPATKAGLAEVLAYENALDFSALDKTPINSYYISNNSYLTG